MNYNNPDYTFINYTLTLIIPVILLARIAFCSTDLLIIFNAIQTPNYNM